MQLSRSTLCALFVSPWLLAHAVGCDEPPPEVATPTVPAPPRPAPLDALEEAMRAREGSEAFSLTPFGTPLRVTLADGERQSFTEVLHAGFCYKLLVEGGASVGDVDAYLYDANNVLVQQDARVGRTLALGSDRPICIQDPMVARTELRMVEGSGPLLAQWYVNH